EAHAEYRAAVALEAEAARSRPRLREWFPETLIWRPELITDDQGRASLDLRLADSITSWRLTASAVTPTGKLGAATQHLRVFQPFFVDLNLPVALTRGDEVDVPVVVYTYLPKPQTIELQLKREPWFELREEPPAKLEMPVDAVRAFAYKISVKKVGLHTLQVE